MPPPACSRPTGFVYANCVFWWSFLPLVNSQHERLQSKPTRFTVGRYLKGSPHPERCFTAASAIIAALGRKTPPFKGARWQETATAALG